MAESHLGVFYPLNLDFLKFGLIWYDLDCCIGGEDYRGTETFQLPLSSEAGQVGGVQSHLHLQSDSGS